MRTIGTLALLIVLLLPGQGVAGDRKTIEANGTSLEYVDQGSGEPVVFIHGGLSDLRSWGSIQPLMAAKHRFIALNLRYFGTADWPDDGTNFTADTHIADVAAFIEALDAGPVHLVGWSFGADIATGVALANPELVKSLTLFEPTLGGFIDPGPAGDGARAKQVEIFGPVLAALDAEGVEVATKRSVEGVLGMEPGSFDSLDEGFRTVFLENARTLPLWLAMPGVTATCDDVGALDKPVLVIHSDVGQQMFDHIAESMAACLANGRLIEMANSNHAGPAQHPDVMVELISSLIASN